MVLTDSASGLLAGWRKIRVRGTEQVATHANVDLVEALAGLLDSLEGGVAEEPRKSLNETLRGLPSPIRGGWGSFPLVTGLLVDRASHRNQVFTWPLRAFLQPQTVRL